LEGAEKSKKVILFLDEINTNHLCSGLLKEIIIDKRFEGLPLDPRIVVIATCNPYKLKEHKDQNITGGIRKKMLQEDQNFKLVYRVHPFPHSVFYFIHNYDTLQPKDLEFYIQRILERSGFFEQDEIDYFLTKMVIES